ncbi:hypothetical protein GF337_01870 [candidate division KSB1 bacterium]|nr:hypothetical protein [candidate division KSB1 bacterium]
MPSIKKNIVKITARFPDNSEATGFGFIFHERNDSLFIVSSLNVFISGYGELVEQLTIHYYNTAQTTTAKPLSFWSMSNFALVGTSKPPGFQWDENYHSVHYLNENEIVWLIGRYGKWNDASREYIGQIASSDYKEMHIDLPTDDVGSTGAVAVFDDRIAGMVINDQGNYVTVLNINMIEKMLYDYFSIRIDQELEKPYHVPYIICGVNGGLPFALNDKTRGMKFFPHYGLFFDLGITNHLSLRVQKEFSKFVSYSYQIWDNEYQFQNNYHPLTFILQVNVRPTTFEAANSFLFLGYSTASHNPQVKLNGGPWKSLNQYPEFNDTYSEKFNSYSIGLGGDGFLSDHLIFGFELSLQYNTSKYLFLNPLDPFANNKHNDWLIQLKFRTGVVIGNRKPHHKFLIPEPQNPFYF